MYNIMVTKLQTSLIQEYHRRHDVVNMYCRRIYDFSSHQLK